MPQQVSISLPLLALLLSVIVALVSVFVWVGKQWVRQSEESKKVILHHTILHGPTDPETQATRKEDGLIFKMEVVEQYVVFLVARNEQRDAHEAIDTGRHAALDPAALPKLAPRKPFPGLMKKPPTGG